MWLDKLKEIAHKLPLKVAVSLCAWPRCEGERASYGVCEEMKSCPYSPMQTGVPAGMDLVHR